jgi:UDP-2,3-diacylglucosamine hydrolase
LFDYWFEYRRVIQRDFISVLHYLKSLSDKKIKVHYLIGNHDFMHRNFFEEDLGINIYENDLSYKIGEKNFYMGHGDGLVKNDIGYLILKKILRNKTIQNLFSLIHPDLGIWIASRTSKKSRDYTSAKSYGEIDGVFEVAKQKIELGYDYVLFGHTHKRVFEKYKNGFYINLGTWLEKPCYGMFDGINFKIIDWD